MEQKIKNRFTQNILEQIIQRFDVSLDNLKELDAFESFIYEYALNGQDYILRIGHSNRRTPQMIQAEVDWINYLAEGGGAVSKAVMSKVGNLVEQVPDSNGDFFLATSFVKAKGKIVWGSDQWNQTLFKHYGREIGKFHALSKSYLMPAPEFKRYEWDDKEMIDMESWLPPSEQDVFIQYQNLKKDLDILPKDQDNYGLIHQDAHGGNFFVDQDGNFTFFDFDDCAYSWYANDIGISFFYGLGTKSDNPNYQKEFVLSFIAGYQQSNYFDPDWLEQIPKFIKLREMDLYGVIHRDFDMDNLEHDPWVARFMDGRREKILDHIPVFDLDFSTINIE